MSKEEKAGVLTVLILFIVMNAVMYCENVTDTSVMACENAQIHQHHQPIPCNITKGNFFPSLNMKIEKASGKAVADFVSPIVRVIFGIGMLLALATDVVLGLFLVIGGIYVLLILLPYKLSLLCLTSGEKCKTLWEAMRRKNEEEANKKDLTDEEKLIGVWQDKNVC